MPKKTWGKSDIIWKTEGIFGLEAVGGKRLFSFTDDNVRSNITVLQNEDPVLENWWWKTLGLHCAARCPSGCQGCPPAAGSGARQGPAGNFVPVKLCWNQKKPPKLARTLVRDVKFFCDHMLLELWCISATDVLLEPSFSMFWFNSSNSSRIFLSELALHALWLQIILPSAVILVVPREQQLFAKRNTFSSVNTTVKEKNSTIDYTETSLKKKCIKILSACHLCS